MRMDLPSTVECLRMDRSAAVDPGAPADITDGCGRTVSAVLVGSVETPDPLTCEGTIIYTYTYTDCSGLTCRLDLYLYGGLHECFVTASEWL
jgi:hypothetical protein